jgi:hypothetical protein
MQNPSLLIIVNSLRDKGDYVERLIDSRREQTEPHVPVFDKSERNNDICGRSDFSFDAWNNRNVRPQGAF